MSGPSHSPTSPLGPTPPPKSPIHETLRSTSNPPNPIGRGLPGRQPVSIPVVDADALPPRSVSLTGHARSMATAGEDSTIKGKGKGRVTPLHLNPHALHSAGSPTLSPLRDAGTPISPLPPHSATSVTSPATASIALSSARRKMEDNDREAMRKLRSTLLDGASTHRSEGSGSSTGTHSPISPMYRVSSTSSGGHGVKVSGLSQHVTSTENGDADEEEAEAEIDFRVAVVGHAGCGKSTFIRKALKSWGVKERAEGSALAGLASASYVSHIQPGGKVRYSWMTEFLELDMLRLADPSSSSASGGASKILGEVSGVILCYDVQRAESFAGIPELLEIISRKNLPAILLGCKSDPDSTAAVLPGSANSVAQPYNIGLIEVSTATNEGRSKMKNGVRWLVFKLEQRIRREQRNALAGSSTESSAVLKETLNHATRVKSYDSSTDGTLSNDDHILYATSQLSITPGPSIPPTLRDKPSAPASPQRPPRPMSAQSGVSEPPLQSRDYANGTSGTNGTPNGTQTSGEWGHLANTSAAPTALSAPLYLFLEDLLNRLFASIVAAEDDTFIAAFFMTYRRFLSPTDLMRDFLERYKEIDLYTISKDIKYWALSKMTGALILWTSTYPVDLADDATQALFRECLALILRYPVIAHLVQNLVDIEEKLYDIDDLDASWSLRPPSSSTGADDPVPMTPASEIMIDPDVVYDYDSIGRSEGEKMVKTGSASTNSYSTSSLALEDSSAAQSGSFRSGSDPRFGVIPEDVSPVGDAGFGRWSHAFAMVINMQPERFAMELTRLQWEIFRTVRARDVLRHDIGKERDTPISSSITFFNHLSRFVSTLVLANPKPKHRAKAYEKFMGIVSALRRLRNYDGMCAVLAGMQEVSVLRMTQTTSLVLQSESTGREWKSNKMLMDPRGGYSAYRGAIKADLDQGKPAIPLLTALLGMVSRLNAVRAADMREDGAVQWDKFAKFGEYLSIIPDFQIRGPPIAGEASSAFRAMLEDTPVITNEDGLYERSKLLEPGGPGTSGRNMLRRLKMV